MTALTEDQRRAWRLALLVTGRADLADTALLAAMQRRVALRSLPQARRDRLTLICVREILGEATMRRPGFLERLRSAHRSRRGAGPISASHYERIPFDGIAADGADAMRALREQPREAWALHRVLNMDLRDVARAMDCSKTAAARHLEEAESAMAGALGPSYVRVIEALRIQSDAARPGTVVLESLAAQRTGKLVARVVFALLSVVLIAAAVAAVLYRLQRPAL
jgi:hypothetical protein